jgi:3-deoxy-7-phosphoheptulonate synthase
MIDSNLEQKSKIAADLESTDLMVILKADAADADARKLEDLLGARGIGVKTSRGADRIIIGAFGMPGSDKEELTDLLEGLVYVDRVISFSKPYKMVSRELRPEGSVVKVREIAFGGKRIPVMAGPCCVESEDQIFQIAREVKEAGGSLLRGGAFKPSTSPYSFQGLGVDGLRLLAAAREATGLGIVTEVLAVNHVEIVAAYADMLQIGTRNMQNYPLLKEVGLTRKPVLLKRGMSATLEEWLQAAEYIASYGNLDIVLCERGIRSFESYYRNVFDVNALIAIKELSHLPTCGDPSHGTGKASLVAKASLAAVAAGADSVIVEIHPCPAASYKDGKQTLDFEQFRNLMGQIRQVAEAVHRSI